MTGCAAADRGIGPGQGLGGVVAQNLGSGGIAPAAVAVAIDVAAASIPRLVIVR